MGEQERLKAYPRYIDVTYEDWCYFKGYPVISRLNELVVKYTNINHRASLDPSERLHRIRIDQLVTIKGAPLIMPKFDD